VKLFQIRRKVINLLVTIMALEYLVKANV